MSAEQIDLLCNHCGQAFSAFLHEMADHNAKVTSCPNCGKVHDVKPPKTAKPVARARPIKKTYQDDLAGCGKGALRAAVALSG